MGRALSLPPAFSRRRPKASFALALGALALACPPAGAHQLGVVRVQLSHSGPHYSAAIQLPPSAQLASMAPVLPESCRADPPILETRGATAGIHVGFVCETTLKPADVLQLPWPFQGAFVSTQSGGGLLNGRFFQGDATGIEIPLGSLANPARSSLGVAQRYLRLGVGHILTGWDHLSFVLALCMVASGFRLLKLVSAFTLGHSLTLALATAGLVRVPIPPTEACIALSIAFMARAAVRRDAVRHGAGLVFSFGLLHGLGFATALAESGIERSEFFLGLATFNLGVECGQLLFVGVALSIALLGRFVTAQRRARLATATAYALGITGAFWTFQRMFG